MNFREIAEHVYEHMHCKSSTPVLKEIDVGHIESSLRQVYDLGKLDSKKPESLECNCHAEKLHASHLGTCPANPLRSGR